MQNTPQNTISKEPLFSVLIANYNNGKYLMDAIDSVRQQTYTHWEIILVDDASTDNSKELYKELEKNERIHIYCNEENRGCGYTKRRCAELANGEICGFLDPDDSLINTALEKHVAVHINNPLVSIIYSKAYLYDTNHNLICTTELPDYSTKTYFDYRGIGSMHLATYKKKFYEKTEGINPLALAGVDQDLYFKLEEVGLIYPLNEFTYNYVIMGHENSISNSFSNYVRLWYWNMEVRRQTCVRRGLDTDHIMLLDWIEVFDNYGKAYVYNKEKAYIQRCVNEQLNACRRKAIVEVRQSLTYRVGQKVLSPLVFLKSIMRTIILPKNQVTLQKRKKE